MKRISRTVLIILMAFPLLAKSVCASEDLSTGLTGDPRRREGPDVKLLHYENLIIYKYNNGSFWLILPFKDENLFLKSGGLAFQFSKQGEILARGNWDKTSGVVEALNGIPSDILSEVKDALFFAGGHVDVKDPHAGAPQNVPSDSRKGVIEWTQ